MDFSNPFDRALFGSSAGKSSSKADQGGTAGSGSGVTGVNGMGSTSTVSGASSGANPTSFFSSRSEQPAKTTDTENSRMNAFGASSQAAAVSQVTGPIPGGLAGGFGLGARDADIKVESSISSMSAGRANAIGIENIGTMGKEFLDQLLIEAMEAKASDVHITVALPPMMRVNGQLKPMRDFVLMPENTEKLCLSMLNAKQRDILEEKGEVDFSYGVPNVSRFRVNVYRQRRSITAAIRIITTNIPTLQSLGFPKIMEELAMKPRGLILVTGPTGSGKSTTLAAMVNYINQSVDRHILTLEEPLEYLHKHGKSMVNQREIGDDSLSFGAGLRAALREDPDVILVGEMRDLETISTAISAAETGHLVMSTLHTTSAPQTIDRIIDVFPPYQQTQIRVQLASVLQGIIAQQLLITADGKSRVAALEILIGTDAVRNTIREGKIHQVSSYIQTGQKYGMMSMDFSLAQLVKSARISTETAFSYCQDRDMLQRYLVSDPSLF